VIPTCQVYTRRHASIAAGLSERTDEDDDDVEELSVRDF
jgi:hypothetical protein